MSHALPAAEPASMNPGAAGARTRLHRVRKVRKPRTTTRRTTKILKTAPIATAKGDMTSPAGTATGPDDALRRRVKRKRNAGSARAAVRWQSAAMPAKAQALYAQASWGSSRIVPGDPQRLRRDPCRITVEADLRMERRTCFGPRFFMPRLVMLRVRTPPICALHNDGILIACWMVTSVACDSLAACCLLWPRFWHSA